MKTTIFVFVLLVFASIAWSSAAHSVPASQTIKICKQAKFAGTTPFPFQWSNRDGAQTGFTLKAGECVTKVVDMASGPNVFQETMPSGWALGNISCDNAGTVRITGAGDNPSFQPGDTTLNIDPKANAITCTFTNQGGKASESSATKNNALAQLCCDFELDLSTGQNSGPIDSLWTISPNSAYITTTLAGAWMDLLPAKWLQPTNKSTPDKNVTAATFKYSAQFDVPFLPKWKGVSNRRFCGRRHCAGLS